MTSSSEIDGVKSDEMSSSSKMDDVEGAWRVMEGLLQKLMLEIEAGDEMSSWRIYVEIEGDWRSSRGRSWRWKVLNISDEGEIGDAVQVEDWSRDGN